MVNGPLGNVSVDGPFSEEKKYWYFISIKSSEKLTDEELADIESALSAVYNQKGEGQVFASFSGRKQQDWIYSGYMRSDSPHIVLVTVESIQMVLEDFRSNLPSRLRRKVSIQERKSGVKADVDLEDLAQPSNIFFRSR